MKHLLKQMVILSLELSISLFDGQNLLLFKHFTLCKPWSLAKDSVINPMNLDIWEGTVIGLTSF